MKKFNLVLFGAPGCGKGTQAEKIAAKYGLESISTGQLYRNEIANKTELGLEAKKLIDAGKLCPDELTLNMLNKRMGEADASSNGFIFDGVPRTIEQAQMMDGIGYDKPVDITLVVYLKVDNEEVTRRILERAKVSGRADDTPEVIKSRLENYFALTQPLESYYAKQNKIYHVDGMNTIEKVFEDVCKVIDTVVK